VIPTLTIVAVLHGVAAVILLLFVVVVDTGRVVNKPEDAGAAAALRGVRRGPRVAGALPPLTAGPGRAGVVGGHLLALPLHRHGGRELESGGGGEWGMGNGDDANDGVGGLKERIYHPGQPLPIPRSGVCRCLPGVPRNSSEEKLLDLLRPMGGG
jgi:hypothetical protein